MSKDLVLFLFSDCVWAFIAELSVHSCYGWDIETEEPVLWVTLDFWVCSKIQCRELWLKLQVCLPLFWRNLVFGASPNGMKLPSIHPLQCLLLENRLWLRWPLRSFESLVKFLCPWALNSFSYHWNPEVGFQECQNLWEKCWSFYHFKFRMFF